MIGLGPSGNLAHGQGVSKDGSATIGGRIVTAEELERVDEVIKALLAYCRDKEQGYFGKKKK